MKSSEQDYLISKLKELKATPLRKIAKNLGVKNPNSYQVDDLREHLISSYKSKEIRSALNLSRNRKIALNIVALITVPAAILSLYLNLPKLFSQETSQLLNELKKEASKVSEPSPIDNDMFDQIDTQNLDFSKSFKNKVDKNNQREQLQTEYNFAVQITNAVRVEVDGEPVTLLNYSYDGYLLFNILSGKRIISVFDKNEKELLKGHSINVDKDSLTLRLISGVVSLTQSGN